MTNVQAEAIEQLITYGFDPYAARILIRTRELDSPLQLEVRLNAELLNRYINKEELSRSRLAQIIVFLKRDHHVNLLLETVPERYAFSDEQRDLYFKQILEWEVACDLKAEIDGQLRLIMPDETDRMNVYREMYCNGAWHDSATIGNICVALQKIAFGNDDLYRVAKQQWPTLFSYYSGTLQYIRKLKELFKDEYVWTVFRETSANVREFTSAFNPFDRKQIIVEELRKKYLSYLKEEADEYT